MIDDSKNLLNKRKFKKMTGFQDIYRNSSKQSNVVIFGDLIQEFFNGSIDTLVVPFDKEIYCNEISVSTWCHTWNLDLLIYPIVVSYDKNFSHNLTKDEYFSLKNNTDVQIAGSSNTIINLIFKEPRSEKIKKYLKLFRSVPCGPKLSTKTQICEFASGHFSLPEGGGEPRPYIIYSSIYIYMYM